MVKSLCWSLTISAFVLATYHAPLEAEERSWQDDEYIEELTALNSKALFGVDAKFSDGTVKLLFNKAGQMVAGFNGDVWDSKHPKMSGSNRRFIQLSNQGGKEQLLPGLAAAGIGRGKWRSRFRLGGNVEVSFAMRIPNLLTRQSQVRVRIEHKKNRGWETNFFNNLSRVSGGKARGTIKTKKAKFKGTAGEWFPRQGKAIPVKFGFENGTLGVTFNRRKLVSTKKARDKGGQVVFMFNKIAFTLQDLKITGTLDYKWCRKELKKLEKAKTLVLEAPPDKKAPPAEEGSPPAEEDSPIEEAGDDEDSPIEEAGDDEDSPIEEAGDDEDSAPEGDSPRSAS